MIITVVTIFFVRGFLLLKEIHFSDRGMRRVIIFGVDEHGVWSKKKVAAPVQERQLITALLLHDLLQSLEWSLKKERRKRRGEWLCRPFQLKYILLAEVLLGVQ